jgi:hypothetical protein
VLHAGKRTTLHILVYMLRRLRRGIGLWSRASRLGDLSVVVGHQVLLDGNHTRI